METNESNEKNNEAIEKQSKDLVKEILGFCDEEEKKENNNIEENNNNGNGETQENKNEDKKEEENKINNEEKKSEVSNQNNVKEENEKEKEAIKTPEKINHNKSKKKVASTKKINKSKNLKPKTAKKKNNSIDDKVYSHNHYRNENIKNYIKYKESKEIAECSFKPKLNTDVPKFEDTKINGTKKYLERIKNSREIQKQKEEKLNPNYNDLYNKYYKKKEKTILDKNKKLTKKEYQNYLNVFHNALMNDDDDD